MTQIDVQSTSGKSWLIFREIWRAITHKKDFPFTFNSKQNPSEILLIHEIFLNQTILLQLIFHNKFGNFIQYLKNRIPTFTY